MRAALPGAEQARAGSFQGGGYGAAHPRADFVRVREDEIAQRAQDAPGPKQAAGGQITRRGEIEKNPGGRLARVTGRSWRRWVGAGRLELWRLAGPFAVDARLAPVLGPATLRRWLTVGALGSPVGTADARPGLVDCSG